jgi:hypothetical protein
MRAFRVLIVVALILIPIMGIPTVRAPTTENPTPEVPDLDTSDPNTPDLNTSNLSIPVSKSPGTIKQPLNNSTSYLAIDREWINTTRIDTVTLDVGGAVVIDAREIVQEFSIERFHATYQNASDETRQDVIDSALDRAANQTSTLRARQASAIEAYNTDELSTQAFLRKLAVIAAEASHLRGFVESVGQYANESTQIRVRTLEKELSALAGPVRTRIQSALHGEPDAPNRYFIETSPRGVILATIDDNEYIREVYLAAARTAPNSTEPISFGEAYNTVIRDLYPFVPLSNINTNGDGKIYKFSFGHSYGDLTVYMDKTTGKVFYEQQILELDDTHTAFGQQKSNGSFALTTRETYPGGYMLVRVTNPANGNPRNGTVAINGETVGVTSKGEDDKNSDLYILQPRKKTTITVTVNGNTKSVTVGNTSVTPPPRPIPTPPARAADSRDTEV